VNRLRVLIRTTRFCRALAFGAWTLLAGLFLLGQFAFLGWVGPGPVFIYWTILAAPLLAVTVYWLRHYLASMPWKQVALASTIWGALIVGALTNHFTELHGVAAWATFLGLLLFPLVLTYRVLTVVEDRVPVRGTA
jgi:O-antigen/teichoic acid export membrane protein